MFENAKNLKVFMLHWKRERFLVSRRVFCDKSVRKSENMKNRNRDLLLIDILSSFRAVRRDDWCRVLNSGQNSVTEFFVVAALICFLAPALNGFGFVLMPSWASCDETR